MAVQVEPLALVGMACRFPGGASSGAAFWDLLTSGRDAIVDVPADRWDLRRFYDEDPAAPGKMYVRQGGFLQERIDEIDAAFFGIAPREAAVLDPQQRLLLEVTWDALEDAGLPATALRGTRIGVFIGGFCLDNQITQLGVLARDAIMANTATSATMVMLSNRLSYTFDLRGPSMTVDTACSSSLVALHLACQSVWRGESEAAIAGGVNVMMRPEFPITMCKGGFLSRDARCKSFDASGDGYARGEGAGVVVVKPLRAAQRDRDRIYALIRATGANQDGRTVGITVPSEEAQRALLRQVFAEAGVSPADVHVIEAHGTGTRAGDPVEARALGSVIGEHRAAGREAYLGSVKTNIGHLEAGAGIAGVIKLALALHHRTVPPSLHFETPNPAIDFAGLGLRVPTELVPLPADGVLLGTVNSFGYGGANANAVMSSVEPGAAAPRRPRHQPAIYPITARDPEALAERARELASWLASHPDDLDDIGATLALRRSHEEHRGAIVAGDRAELIDGLCAIAARSPRARVHVGRAVAARRVAFVYPGMGAQSWGMGRELWRTAATFRATVEECDAVWRRLGGESLQAWFEGSARTGEPMTEPVFAQPANLVMQVGITRLLRERGVTPSLVIGHSVGEIAAACAAGTLTLDAALELTFHRSHLQQRLFGRGGMLAVGLGADEVTPLVAAARDVAIAAINSPSSCTLAGDRDALATIGQELERRWIFHAALQVGVAYHSPHLDELEGEFLRATTHMRPHAPNIRLLSTVDGTEVTDARQDARYWWANAREPVLLRAALELATGEDFDLFVEIGPHPVLAQAIHDTARGQGRSSVTSVPTLRRKHSEHDGVLGAIASVFVSGGAVDWEASYERRPPVALPRYPFQRKPLWSEPSPARADRCGDNTASPLLQERVAGTDTWLAELSRGYLPWRDEHVVDGAVVLPGAAYAVAALAVAPVVERARCVRRLQLARALVIDAPRQLRIVVGDGGRITFHSRRIAEPDAWIAHAAGELPPAMPGPRRDRLDDALEHRLAEGPTCEAFYRTLAGHGLAYGPAFRGVRRLRIGKDEVLATLVLPPGVDDAERWPLHPCLLDAAFQALFAAVAAADTTLMIPVAIAELRLYRDVPSASEVRVHGIVRQRRAREFVADLTFADAGGAVCAEVFGLRCQQVGTFTSDDAALAALYHVDRWEVCPLPERRADIADWVVIGEGELAEVLCEALSRQSHVRRIPRGTRSPAPVGAGIVWMAPPPGPDLAASATAAVTELAQLVQELAGAPVAKLVVLAREARHDPAHGAVWGLGRVARTEHPELGLQLVDTCDDIHVATLADVIAATTVEDELALAGDQIRARRLVRAKADAPARREEIGGPAMLSVEDPSDRAAWTRIERRRPGAGEVEVAVTAFALSTTRGMHELAGVVTDVGADVGDLGVGDAVICFADDDGLRTHVTTPARHVVKKPPAHALEEAVCHGDFVTAHYALGELGRLARGERVLIHDATTHVGLAAIQVARRVGATIHATARDASARAYLRELGIEHVYDARTLEFSDAIVADTHGAGIDVVLDSLGGEALVRSLECLAPCGRVVELARTDRAATSLALDRVASNLTFAVLDIARLRVERPVMFRRLLDEVGHHFIAGTFAPLPARSFPARDTAEALGAWTRADHVGKLVIRHDGQQRVVATPPAVIRGDGTYVITGGFGGFGSHLARWLVAQGARSVALVGRRGGDSAEARQQIDALRSRGVDVLAIAADVSTPAGCAHVLAQLGARRLGGIFHAAMVLDDGFLRGLTPARIATVMGPKAAGAWHLHELTRDRPLDCFVLFSSVALAVGNAGQGSYVAANAFLAALAQHRRRLGMPGTCVDWGVIADAGVVARSADLESQLARHGIRGLRVATCLRALDGVLERGDTHVGVFDIDWARWAQMHPDLASAPRYAALVEAAGSTSAGESPLRALLADVDPTEHRVRVTELVVAQIARVLRMDVAAVAADVGLGRLGVDSLMAVEIAAALTGTFGVAMSSMAIVQGPSAEQLADTILRHASARS